MSQDEVIDDLLLAKFLAGEATPEEAITIMDWIEKSGENKLLFRSSQKAFYLQNEINVAASEKAAVWRAVSRNRIPAGRRSFFTPVRIAAGVVLLMAAGIAIYMISGSDYSRERWITEHSKQEIFKFPLPEGTSVVLNTNSVLSHPEKFNGTSRTVSLSGEGFFDVTHNPNQPFVIEAGEITIKVLGTAFNVSNVKGASSIETKVIRGRVLMYDKANSIVIDAGWTGFYDKQSKLLSLKRSDERSENELGYATHTFTFEDTSIRQVTDHLGKSFGVSFVFENEKIKDCRLTSSYHDKSLSFILDVISESLNITYTVKGKVVYISGDGCL